MVKKVLFIIGLLIFLLIFADLLAYGLIYFKNKTRAPEQVLVINYQRSGGFAGVDERWLICNNGFVRVTFYDRGEEGSGHVGARAVADLLRLIKKEGFFSFEGRYGFPTDCRDCFTHRIAVFNEGKWKVVTAMDGADAPEGLWRIIGELNKLTSRVGRP